MLPSVDQLLQDAILGDADPDLYSAAQVTDLLAAYFEADADAESECWLGFPDPEDGLRRAA